MLKGRGRGLVRGGGVGGQEEGHAVVVEGGRGGG